MCVIISKSRSGMFLLYSFTSAQSPKITKLGYGCATTASFKVTMLYNCKYNIHKTFVTERKICDGKDILVYDNNYQHKSNTRG